ncbi:hypothetical protein FOFC_10668 [Fusarium oxysporum]|nr:hypothetical protein FOFC_10668 [Fusarium oxysporum]
MRFSLQSLAIGLVSSQARLALASPCKPLTTTTLAATTTTAAVEEASTTTAISEGSTTTVEGQTTIVTLSEATTTTALSDLSTTLTTLTLSEASTTTTLGEESTTTALTEEPTTTTFEATTTTAAETTTTTEAPRALKWPLSSPITPRRIPISINGARFELEPETNRLFTYLIDGTKVYLFTVIPDDPNYAFQFDTAANIDSTTVYHYVLCTADADNVLSCASESGPTPIFWYWVEGASRYYGNSSPTFDSSPVVHFKLG